MRFKALALMAALCAPIMAFADPQKPSDTTATSKDTSNDTSMHKHRSTTTAKAKLTDAEMQVLAHYHHVNKEEIDAGKMAQRQGSTQAVKDFGKQLVTDHTQNDKELMAFAKKQGVSIPAVKPTNEAEKQEMKDDQEAMMKVKKLKGADFDRAFAQQMVMGHEKELAKIDSNINIVQQSDLAQLLRDTKPVLQRHADTARELQKTNAQASLNQSDVDRTQNQDQNRNQVNKKTPIK